MFSGGKEYFPGDLTGTVFRYDDYHKDHFDTITSVNGESDTTIKHRIFEDGTIQDAQELNKKGRLKEVSEK